MARMFGDKGARQGERCGACGDPMNPGYTVCSDCGAIRSEEASVTAFLIGLVIAVVAFYIATPFGEGTQWTVAVIAFFVAVLRGPRNVIYRIRGIS